MESCGGTILYKQNMKRRSQLTAAVLCGALMLGCSSGCGTKDTASDETVVSVAGFFSDESVMPEVYERQRKQADEFEKLHPGVKIEQSDFSFDSQSFLAKAEGGTLPTLYYVPLTEANAVLDMGYGADITDEFKKRGMIDNANTFILENTLCSDIIENNNSCHGIIALNNNIQYNIHSQFVIMATGGIGGLFKNSTNRRHITGDGLSICKKHNIKLKNLNYVQFHPTALYIKGSSDRRLLISESVRGEGALIKNKQGERFIDELLPRDVVANAIYNELNSSGEECVYLDLSTMKPEYIKNRFPYIYKECLSHGIDITKEYIPIHPVQHYFMGGIDVNLNSESSMKKLYAVGECSCTGVHGANRLASNSLLEGLVFSKRAVNDILSKFKENQAPYEATYIKASSMRLAEAELFDTAINLFKDMIGEKKNELVNC